MKTTIRQDRTMLSLKAFIFVLLATWLLLLSVPYVKDWYEGCTVTRSSDDMNKNVCRSGTYYTER